MRNISISKPKLLLGEGEDESQFLSAFVAHMAIDDIQVIQYGGKSRMEAGLKGIVNLSNFDRVVSLGITRDADYFENPLNVLAKQNNVNEVQATFNAICAILRNPKINLPAPTSPKAKALAEGKPAVQVFILPDCERAGMLEDLCLATLEAMAEQNCIENYFSCIQQVTKKIHPTHKLSKARLHAWLAAQEEPDLTRLGIAAAKGYLNFNHPAFDQLKAFIQAL